MTDIYHQAIRAPELERRGDIKAAGWKDSDSDTILRRQPWEDTVCLGGGGGEGGGGGWGGGGGGGGGRGGGGGGEKKGKISWHRIKGVACKLIMMLKKVRQSPSSLSLSLPAPPHTQTHSWLICVCVVNRSKIGKNLVVGNTQLFGTVTRYPFLSH